MIPVGFMFIQCTKGSEDKILDVVRSIPEVTYAYKVDKAYDIVIRLESDSLEKFTSAITVIRSTPGLLNTDTMIGFRRQ
ncbi:MAG TPA: Lrp/AsnC ligand binding domain-containing protein [Nitrososphaera sp.]|jgi:DNA-binding Lrp family transcriptional regulator|nr:Lrp/AsnC ligand binding domain-containing protein [Nitrososphaera sp.]